MRFPGGAGVGKALRFRPGQAVALVLLSTMLCGAATFAPLYLRATEQALVVAKIADNPIAVTGLQVQSTPAGTGIAQPNQFDSSGPPLGFADLHGLLPASLAHELEAPLNAADASANVYPPATSKDPAGAVLWRTGICSHVHIVSGACPRRAGDLLISTTDSRLFHLHVGTALRLSSRLLGPAQSYSVPVPARIVGVYDRQIPGRFWYGQRLMGASGTVDRQGTGVVVLHDDWITAQATLSDTEQPPLPDLTRSVLLPVRPSIGIDDFLPIGPALRTLTDTIDARDDAAQLSVLTGLPGLVADVHAQEHQALVTVPLLMAQVALLSLFVLWLVLATVADQRRPEVALALLRGRGRRGAGRLLLAELLPATTAGLPLGMLAGLAVSTACRLWVLPGSVPFELPASFWLVALGLAVLLVTTTVIAVLRVTRQPVHTLLQRVPVRSTGWRLGVTEAVLIAACATVVAAFVAGGLTGSVALIGPAVLALLIGLLLSHLTAPVTDRLGRHAVRRGRLGAGLSLLEAARSPATRRTIALVTVATALLVFSADAVAVGARNRQLAAEQDVGAARVISVDGSNLPALRAALRGADPAGRSVTPVVTIQQPGTEGAATLAVVPNQFARIGLLAGSGISRVLTRLEMRTPPPLRISTGSVALAVSRSSLSRSGFNTHAAVILQLQVIYADGSTGNIDLGTLPRQGSALLRSAISCTSGCTVVGLSVVGSPGSTVQGRFDLGPLQTAAGRQSVLGTPSDWTTVDSSSGQITASDTAPGGGLAITVNTAGSISVTLPHAWLPPVLPAIVTGQLPAGGQAKDFLIAGLSGTTRPATQVARVRRIPSMPPNSTLIDLDLVERGSGLGNFAMTAWLGSTSAALDHRVTTTLAAHGLHVAGDTTVAQDRRGYDRSAAAWSLQLGVVTGILGVLIALLVLVVMTLSQWRLRSHDLAALRMAGLGVRRLRQVTGVGQLVPIVFGVVLGAVAGLLGAQLAMASVPIFAQPPAISTLDLSTAWPISLLSAALAMVVLGVAGWVLGRATAHRAELDRIREAQ